MDKSSNNSNDLIKSAIKIAEQTTKQINQMAKKIANELPSCTENKNWVSMLGFFEYITSHNYYANEYSMPTILVKVQDTTNVADGGLALLEANGIKKGSMIRLSIDKKQIHDALKKSSVNIKCGENQQNTTLVTLRYADEIFFDKNEIAQNLAYQMVQKGFQKKVSTLRKNNMENL